MTFLLAVCLVGNAVFAKLPTDHQPTLRQAIAAAGVPAPTAHFANINNEITGWSYECDADNYAAAYFVDTAPPSEFGELWIARYDADHKSWTESSMLPPGSDTKVTEAQQVITLFYDGYYLYVQLQNASDDPTTLQFGRELDYKREFFGTTLAGLPGGVLLFAPSIAAPLPQDPLVATFDPDSGKSTALFPPDPATTTIARGIAVETKEFAACGRPPSSNPSTSFDDRNPLRHIIGVTSNYATDSVAFAVIYGTDECKQAPLGIVAATYVFEHPGDAKHVKYVEQPLGDPRKLRTLDFSTMLTKQSLAKLFGPS